MVHYIILLQILLSSPLTCPSAINCRNEPPESVALSARLAGGGIQSHYQSFCSSTISKHHESSYNIQSVHLICVDFRNPFTLVSCRWWCCFSCKEEGHTIGIWQTQNHTSLAAKWRYQVSAILKQFFSCYSFKNQFSKQNEYWERKSWRLFLINSNWTAGPWFYLKRSNRTGLPTQSLHLLHKFKAKDSFLTHDCVFLSLATKSHSFT